MQSESPIVDLLECCGEGYDGAREEFEAATMGWKVPYKMEWLKKRGDEGWKHDWDVYRITFL